MKSSLHRMGIILAVGAVAVVVATIIGPGMQQFGMKQAGSLRDSVYPMLAKDGRFGHVSFHVMTNPALVVEGKVPSADALAYLKKLVVAPDGSHFQIRMNVIVDGDPATRSTKE